MFGEQREDFEGEDGERREGAPSREELRRWRRIGPMGKLHNIVVYIKSSPQRTQVFRNISGGRMVRQDNGTRWNSWYEMLDWTLNQIKVCVIFATK